MSPYETGGTYGKRGLVYYPDVYNNFYSSHGGLVVGVDTSLSDNIQLGIFGNYGDINLTHFSSRYTGGGSWNPSGFGGGVMASYWADNFYVQGALAPQPSQVRTSGKPNSATSSMRPIPLPKTPLPIWAPSALVLRSLGEA